MVLLTRRDIGSMVIMLPVDADLAFNRQCAVYTLPVPYNLVAILMSMMDYHHKAAFKQQQLPNATKSLAERMCVCSP